MVGWLVIVRWLAVQLGAVITGGCGYVAAECDIGNRSTSRPLYVQ